MSVANKVEVKYKEARFYKRTLANLVDFLLFALLFLALFLGVRGIVKSTPTYTANLSRLNQMRVDSGLYVYSSTSQSDTTDIVTFIRQNGVGSYAACQDAEGTSAAVPSGINKFIAYVRTEVGEEKATTVQKDFDDFRLSANLNGTAYYVKTEDGTIKRNLNDDSSVKWSDYYQNLFDNVLVPFIDEHCQGYLVTLFPEYLNLVRWESNMLIYVEVPIAYLVSGVVIYLVPPLIIKRGKMTLGKFIYQIGLADSRLLSCSWKRYLARWFILFFGEFVLSAFTFGIPFLVSFTLMAFSKKHQGFPDFLLGLYEVDCLDNKLYMSYEEITLKNIEGEKKPVDFKMINED